METRGRGPGYQEVGAVWQVRNCKTRSCRPHGLPGACLHGPACGLRQGPTRHPARERSNRAVCGAAGRRELWARCSSSP